MADSEQSPTPTLSGPNLLISPAIIVVIAFGIFILLVVVLLCIRKFLIIRFGDKTWLPDYCKNVECACGCGQGCVSLAERMECQNVPSSQNFLDRLCPSKESCSEFFDKLLTCHCCKRVSEYCKELEICPQSSPDDAFTCPECDCPCNCHCECTPPECQEINCGCFKISCRG